MAAAAGRGSRLGFVLMSCPVPRSVAEAMLAGFTCLALVVQCHAWARISVTVGGEALAGPLASFSRSSWAINDS